MDSVSAELAAHGWRILESSEQEIETGELPSAELVLNMCQGPAASQRLCTLTHDGVTIVNRPESVLACHRHALVRLLTGTGIPFPRTLIVPTWLPEEASRGLADVLDGRDPVWVKRGDVHAERPTDVACVHMAEVPTQLAAFAARGISRAALQEHVSGPVLKFYGLADQSFFRFYEADGGPAGRLPPLDEGRLREVAFGAAARLDLQIFGGDVALPAPDQPVLIDINDWPSFAPFRAEAAQAIARYVQRCVEAGVAA